MSDAEFPLWNDRNLEALSPEARQRIRLEAIKKEYEDAFFIANQIETAAFMLALRLLLRHGRSGYISHKPHFRASGDFLNTGLRMIGPATRITHDDGTGLVVPAIRIGLGSGFDRTAYDQSQSFFKKMHKASGSKRDTEELIVEAAHHIPSVLLHCYMLATYRTDISRPSSEKLSVFKEADALPTRLGRMREIIKYDSLYGSLQAHVKAILTARPAVAMWAAPLPELTTIAQRGFTHLRNQGRTAIPVSDPDQYVTHAKQQLVEIGVRAPVYQQLMEIMHLSEAIDTPVASLGNEARSPVPKK